MSSKYLQVITKMLKILVQAAKKVGVEESEQTIHDLRSSSPHPRVQDSPLLHHLKSRLLHGHFSIEAEKLSIVAQSCLVRILEESGASSSGPGRMPG